MVTSSIYNNQTSYLIYNRTLKILDRKPIRSHHFHVLEKLNMLSFDNFIKLANLRLLYKCLYKHTPLVLSDFVVPLRALGLEQSMGIVKYSYVSLFGQTASSVNEINIWNSLPSEFKLDQDFDHFKLKLKRFLKRNQSCSHK